MNFFKSVISDNQWDPALSQTKQYLYQYYPFDVSYFIQESINPEKSEVFNIPLKILKQSNPSLVIAAIKLKEFYNLTFLGIFKVFPFKIHP